MKLIAFLFSILFLFTNCSSKRQRNTKAGIDSIANIIQQGSNNTSSSNRTIDSGADSVFENEIMDKIYHLPEVQESQRLIDSLTNHKSGVSMIIFKTPTQDSPYYWIQVGYNGTLRFEPYYNFYVYPQKGNEIKFLNTMTDSIMSLKDWRKTRFSDLNHHKSDQ